VGTISLDDHPKGMAGANGRLYVALSDNPRLAIIRTSDNAIEAIQPVGPGGVNGVAVADDQVFTTNRNAATLSINQAGTGAFVRTFPVGNLPWGVGADLDRVYVANFADDTVTTINPTAGSVLRTTSVAGLPAFVAALANRAYVTHINGHLSVIGRDGAVLADLTPGASELWGVALNPNAGLVYLADRPGNRILILSTHTNQTIGSISLPGQPFGLAFNPGSGNLYAVDATTDEVYVVNTRNDHRYGGTLPIGPQDPNEGGQGIAVIDNRVYVGNWLGQSISILDDTACVTRRVNTLRLR
jgi:YVTN family beta-propeller protein